MIQVTGEITEKLKLLSLNRNEKVLHHKRTENYIKRKGLLKIKNICI